MMADPRTQEMSETELLGHVRALCLPLGLLVYHTHDSRRSDPGWPDLAICGERLILRELKTAIGLARRDQVTWMGRLTKAGIDVAIWRPKDLVSGRIATELAAISAKTSLRQGATTS